MKTRNSWTVLWMTLSLLVTTVATADEKKEIILGSVAMDIPAVMHKRLSPLTEYLGNSLGMPVSLHLSHDMGAAINEISNSTVDIAYLTPVAYLKAHEKGGVELIAKTITDGEASFRLMIVVKADSPIKTVADLAGRSFAFGDKKALLQQAVVVGAGLPLEKLGSYQFIGHYDNIANAVMHGDFDAGILKDTTAFKWESKGLRILHSSADLPPYNIVASKSVSKELKEKIKKAFLDLSSKNPQHINIIKALDNEYDGFAATSDAEYDVVRKLIKPFNSK